MSGFWMYVSIPFIFGFIGYITNRMCIKLAIWPIEFIGIPPLLGWQGVVPARSAEIGGDFVKLFGNELLSVPDLFSKIEVERVIQELEPRMMEMIQDLVDTLMMERAPDLWEALPRRIKMRIYEGAKKRAPAVIHEMFGNIQDNIEEVFDIEELLSDAVVKNPQLLVDVMEELGSNEFKWIYNSGLILGFIFGAIQALAWAIYPAPWILPVGGILVGGFTNYLALNTIFEPAEPVTYGPWNILGKQVGPFIRQGAFIKRRAEVGVDVGVFIAAEVMNPQNITKAFLEGPASDKLITLIERQIKDTLDKEAGLAKPFLTLTMGTKRFIELREQIAAHVIKSMPIAMDQMHAYTEESLDIKNVLKETMGQLSATQFADMLRPLFEADEWKLVLLGCVLGAAIGFAQLSMYV